MSAAGSPTGTPTTRNVGFFGGQDVHAAALCPWVFLDGLFYVIRSMLEDETTTVLLVTLRPTSTNPSCSGLKFVVREFAMVFVFTPFWLVPLITNDVIGRGVLGCFGIVGDV